MKIIDPIDRNAQTGYRADRTATLPPFRSRRPEDRAREKLTARECVLQIRKHPLIVLLIATVLTTFLVEMPWLKPVLRWHLLQIMFVVFTGCLAAGLIRGHHITAAMRGASLLQVLTLAWALVEVLRPPTLRFGISGLLRPFAIMEFLRLALCFGVYLTVSQALRAEDLKGLLAGLQLLCVAIAAYGLIQFGDSGASPLHMTSVFGNHEQFGSFLMLFAPVSIMLTRLPLRSQILKFATQTGTILLLCAVLFAQSRSAWIGAACGAAAILAMVGVTGRITLTRRDLARFVAPAAMVILTFSALIFSDQLRPLISDRLVTFSHGIGDASFSDRLHRWIAACRMMREQPITGWGMSSYPVLQQFWTGTGDTPGYVLEHGIGHPNLAHNFYVQWGAETGSVGLTLYLAALAAPLLTMLRCLPAMTNRICRAVLIGCIGTSVCAWADMVSSPSYTYPGESVFLWLILGIGTAVCRLGLGENAPQLRIPLKIWIACLAVGIAVSFSILAIGAHYRS